MLFTERSIWTMVHGIALGGGFLLLFSSAFHCLWSLRSRNDLSSALIERQCGFLARVTAFMAVILWLTVIVGTFVSFPGYRATPPAGTTDLTPYPKELLKSNPDTDWLHSIGMELKEHMPWVPTMLMTAVAFVAARSRTGIIDNTQIRSLMLALLTVTFGVVSFIALIGIFINKVAPLL